LEWWFTSRTEFVAEAAWVEVVAGLLRGERDSAGGDERFSNPGMEAACFIQAMSQMGTPFHLIKEGLTAVKELFDAVAPWALLLLKESMMVKQAILAATTEMVRGTKYRDIWELTVVMEFVRKGSPPEELPLKKLKGRSAFLFMVLLPCRPVGMLMDVSREKWAEDGESLEVPTKEKTNHGKGETVLIIRRCKVANWCPLTCYKPLREQAAERGAPNALWCTE
jgi:hypothetical protein